jgi:Inosine-uridine preferring nucleoside hydrolase
MQFPVQGKPPLGIVFDSDMGNGIDDVLALALLYGFDGKNEARVVGLGVSKSNVKAAALCEVIARFYAGTGPFARTPPIAMADDGKLASDTPMIDGTLAKYTHAIHTLTDTAEPGALIRNAFTAQHDDNCTVVVSGRLTNLARVLELNGAKELISRKVRALCFAGGSFVDAKPEFNVKADMAATRKVLAEWPTPIIMSGTEIGEAVLFPAASIDRDFAWSSAHPIVDAYRSFKAMPYDAPSWAMTAVLHAIRPQEGYFKLSDPGTITVLDDGRTKFTASTNGKHRYLILDPEQRDRIVKAYTEVASAKPVPRVPRFRQQEEQKKKEEEQKNQEAKPPANEKPPV